MAWNSGYLAIHFVLVGTIQVLFSAEGRLYRQRPFFSHLGDRPNFFCQTGDIVRCISRPRNPLDVNVRNVYGDEARVLAPLLLFQKGLHPLPARTSSGMRSQFAPRSALPGHTQQTPPAVLWDGVDGLFTTRRCGEFLPLIAHCWPGPIAGTLPPVTAARPASSW